MSKIEFYTENDHLTENFLVYEVSCNCGCGKTIAHPVHLWRMQALRYMYQKPIDVTSWTRCNTWNSSKHVNGHETSRHLYGLATDIKPRNPLELEYLYKLALKVFEDVVLYAGKGFIHVETEINATGAEIFYPQPYKK